MKTITQNQLKTFYNLNARRCLAAEALNALKPRLATRGAKVQEGSYTLLVSRYVAHVVDTKRLAKYKKSKKLPPAVCKALAYVAARYTVPMPVTTVLVRHKPHGHV